MIKTDVKKENILALEFAKPCETILTKCDNPATCAVWCDHHGLSCDYSGFRCDIHRNLLQREIQRQVDAVNAGLKLRCMNCNENLTGGTVTEHFRWVRI